MLHYASLTALRNEKAGLSHHSASRPRCDAYFYAAFASKLVLFPLHVAPLCQNSKLLDILCQSIRSIHIHLAADKAYADLRWLIVCLLHRGKLEDVVLLNSKLCALYLDDLILTCAGHISQSAVEQILDQKTKYSELSSQMGSYRGCSNNGGSVACEESMNQSFDDFDDSLYGDMCVTDPNTDSVECYDLPSEHNKYTIENRTVTEQELVSGTLRSESFQLNTEATMKFPANTSEENQQTYQNEETKDGGDCKTNLKDTNNIVSNLDEHQKEASDPSIKSKDYTAKPQQCPETLDVPETSDANTQEDDDLYNDIYGDLAKHSSQKSGTTDDHVELFAREYCTEAINKGIRGFGLVGDNCHVNYSAADILSQHIAHWPSLEKLAVSNAEKGEKRKRGYKNSEKAVIVQLVENSTSPQKFLGSDLAPDHR